MTWEEELKAKPIGEVCFNIKLKRKGIMKWLEDRKLIKPKTEGFSLMIKDWTITNIIGSAEKHGGIVDITSTKIFANWE